MKTIKVESIKEHRYGQQVRPVGAVYDAEERHLDTLTKLRWAKVLPVEDAESKPASRRTYQRRDMKAEK